MNGPWLALVVDNEGTLIKPLAWGNKPCQWFVCFGGPTANFRAPNEPGPVADVGPAVSCLKLAGSDRGEETKIALRALIGPPGRGPCGTVGKSFPRLIAHCDFLW